MARNNRRTLVDQLDQKDNLQLVHRAFGHGAMNPHTVERNGRTIDVVLRCDCGVKRRITITRHGFRRGRSRLDYTDAPEYLLTGVGRLDRSERALVTILAVQRLEDSL